MSGPSERSGLPGARSAGARLSTLPSAPFAAVALVAAAGLASAAGAQETGVPVLEGEVVLDGEPVGSGTVTLHRVAGGSGGSVDTASVDPDGRFRVGLPSRPDPDENGHVYFVSTRFRGVLYFGSPVTDEAQLDSIYRLEVHDTIAAPDGGGSFPVEVRNLFVEESEDGWEVVDLMQIRNPGERTVVATAENVAWSYPLPPEASEIEVEESDLVPGAVFFGDGRMRVVAPVPPGDQRYVIRYRVPELEFTVPLPGSTERVDVLVREPVPPVTVRGLTEIQPVELEADSRYRRFAATELVDHEVEIVPGEDDAVTPDAAWIAVVLALFLAGAGVVAVRRGGPADAPADPGPTSREELLVRIAELDERFGGREDLDPGERERYRAERDRLKDRLRKLE